MSNTNRALNRILLALAGLVLLVVGGLTAAAGLRPDVAGAWTTTVQQSVDDAQSLAATAPLPEPFRSWWAIAAVVLLVLAAGLCLLWITRQGGGKTHRVASLPDAGRGRTTVEVGLLSSGVEAAVSGNQAVLVSSVSAWEGRRGTALRLSLQARQGSSPRELADTANQVTQGIFRLLGHEVPVLVRITSGTRARLAGDSRTR